MQFSQRAAFPNARLLCLVVAAAVMTQAATSESLVRRGRELINARHGHIDIMADGESGSRSQLEMTKEMEIELHTKWHSYHTEKGIVWQQTDLKEPQPAAKLNETTDDLARMQSVPVDKSLQVGLADNVVGTELRRMLAEWHLIVFVVLCATGAAGVVYHRHMNRSGVWAHSKSERKDETDWHWQHWKMVPLQVLALTALVLMLILTPTIVVFALAAILWQTGSNTLSLALLSVMLVVLNCGVLLRPVDTAMVGTDILSETSVYGSMRLFGRKPAIVTMMLGWTFCAIIVTELARRTMDTSLAGLVTTYDEDSRVAILGGGASGLSAAYMLSQAGRHVELFEQLPIVGGHSVTHTVHEDDGGSFDVDLGFIFNNLNYDIFMEYSKYFGHELVDSSINMSSNYGGKYWDNVNTLNTSLPEERAFASEVDRFARLANDASSDSLFKTLLPFRLWLRLHNFSEEMYQRVVLPLADVLFVTKMGLAKQSTKVVHGALREKGFFGLRPQDQMTKVQVGRQGSHRLWEKVIQDLPVQMHLNTTVSGVTKKDGLWDITLSNGTVVRGFSKIVFALPADVTAQLVPNSLLRFLLRQVQYVASTATLHTDSNATMDEVFRKAPNNVQYFSGQNAHGISHLTGQIGRVFGRDKSSLLLSVHDESLHLEPGKVITTRTWKHHMFDVWEILMSRSLIRAFDGRDGLHLAGDWMQGVGHNDAMKSGIAAACKVGLRKPDHLWHPHLYTFSIDHLCESQPNNPATAP